MSKKPSKQQNIDTWDFLISSTPVFPRDSHNSSIILNRQSCYKKRCDKIQRGLSESYGPTYPDVCSLEHAEVSYFCWEGFSKLGTESFLLVTVVENGQTQ